MLAGVVVILSGAALAIGFVSGSASANAVEQVSKDVKRITDKLAATRQQIAALKTQFETLRKDLAWFQEHIGAIEWAAHAQSEAELAEQARRQAAVPTQRESDEQRRQRIATMVVGNLSTEEQKSFAEILDEVPNWADPDSDLPDTDNFNHYTGGKCQALIDAALVARFHNIEPELASWLEQQFGQFAVYQVASSGGEGWFRAGQAWRTLDNKGEFFSGVRFLEQTIGLLPPLAEFYAAQASKNPQLVNRLALMLAEAEAKLPRVD
jgi:cell division protein FtsB